MSIRIISVALFYLIPGLCYGASNICALLGCYAAKTGSWYLKLSG